MQLFDSRDVPTQDQLLKAEQKLLVFGRWLGRSYVGDSVVKYIGDVKRAQQRWLGVPLKVLRVDFCRLPVLLKILKREKPGNKRDKTPWPADGFARIRAGAGPSGVFGLFEWAAKPKQLERETTYVTMLIAFEQLLRSDELVALALRAVVLVDDELPDVPRARVGRAHLAARLGAAQSHLLQRLA